MAFILEIQQKSIGFNGAPGYTNLYFDTTITADYTQQFTAANAFFGACSQLFPARWSGQINGSGRLLESTTGILAAFTPTPVEFTVPHPGVNVNAYGAGVAGAVIGWSTATVNRGRVIRGRSYMVPIAAACYQDDGTLTPEALTFLNDAGQALIDSATGFCIWSRPVNGAGGTTGVVVGKRVNDRSAFLSSRRA